MEYDPINATITRTPQEIDALGECRTAPATVPLAEGPALLDQAITRIGQMNQLAGADVSEFPDYARRNNLLGQIERAKQVLPVLSRFAGQLCEVVPEEIGLQAEAFLQEQDTTKP